MAEEHSLNYRKAGIGLAAVVAMLGGGGLWHEFVTKTPTIADAVYRSGRIEMLVICDEHCGPGGSCIEYRVESARPSITIGSCVDGHTVTYHGVDRPE